MTNASEVKMQRFYFLVVLLSSMSRKRVDEKNFLGSTRSVSRSLVLVGYAYLVPCRPCQTPVIISRWTRDKSLCRVCVCVQNSNNNRASGDTVLCSLLDWSPCCEACAQYELGKQIPVSCQAIILWDCSAVNKSHLPNKSSKNMLSVCLKVLRRLMHWEILWAKICEILLFTDRGCKRIQWNREPAPQNTGECWAESLQKHFWCVKANNKVTFGEMIVECTTSRMV